MCEVGDAPATRGHDTPPPRLHFVCSNGPVGEVNRARCDRPVLSTRHRSVRGVPVRSPSFSFPPPRRASEGGTTRPEYVMQITASFGGRHESGRCRDVRNVATGYLGRVSAPIRRERGRVPVEVPARVPRSVRRAGPARGETIPGRPIRGAGSPVDKRPNRRSEGPRGGRGEAVFRARRGALPVTRRKGDALVVSAVLSVGGGGRAHSRRGSELCFEGPTSASVSDPERFSTPSPCSLRAVFAPPSCSLRSLRASSVSSSRLVHVFSVSAWPGRERGVREAPSGCERLVGAGGAGASPARFAGVCHEHRECECARR